MIQKSYDDSPSLYLIPTPIGNMEDITLRAIETLKSVDLILCEDTRETSKLLKKLDISKKVLSCHEWNESQIKDKVVSYLADGLNVGLVTDQGTPIISDPGYVIASEAISSGYNVISLPGATAFVPALTSSGINPAPFIFYGFLNQKETKKKKELKELKTLKYTIVFYEAPHRLYNTLDCLLKEFGDRKIAICRELSKVHEQIYRGNISEFCNNIDSLKGEFVLVVEGNRTDFDYTGLDCVEHVKLYVDDGMEEKEAIKLVAKERGLAKSVVYAEYHKKKRG